MHRASMIATYAAAHNLPVQQTLTAEQCLKSVEKRQKLLAGPTPAKPTLGRKPQLRASHSFECKASISSNQSEALSGAFTPTAALTALGRPIVFTAFHDLVSLCAARTGWIFTAQYLEFYPSDLIPDCLIRLLRKFSIPSVGRVP